MDTEKCKALLHVVESGNIRASAAELGYTPSGLSRMVSSLETELGLTLFVRGRKGVRPTEACKQMLPALKRVAQAGDACEQQARAIAGLDEGRVRIGIAYPQFYGALTRILGDFARLHPAIQMSVREANTTPLLEQLETGELDVAIVSKRTGNFRWQPLMHDRLVALVPAEHPLAHAQAYPLERFAEDPYIEIGPGERTDNALAFARNGIVPNTCFTVSLDGAGYEMVEAGLGVTLTNGIHARSHAESGRTVALPTAPSVQVSVGMAWEPDGIASPSAHAFAEFARPRLLETARTSAGLSTAQAESTEPRR